jgi:predicted nucleotidyltransferase
MVVAEPTPELLDEVVRRIIAVARPERIVLFGSRARDEHRPGSDLDLLIIAHSNEPRHRRSPPIYAALSRIMLPMDVVVYTPQEVHAWRDVPQAFVTTALREGVTLYEKPR